MQVLAGRVGALVVVAVLSVGSVGAVASPAVAGAASLTHDQAFVTAAYEDFLGRAPTSGELSSATSGSLASAAARAHVVSGLANSSEWIRVTVNKLYVDTLGRVGDPGGVNYWVGLLQSHRLSVASVAASFYSSAEYFAGFGFSSVSVWIGDLYAKILLRNGANDPSGVAYWVGQTARVGRQRVAFAFYQSPESAHTRVKALYETLLGRSPDVAGGNYWAGRVVSSGDLVLAANLAESAEYYGDAWGRYGLSVPGAPSGVHASAGNAQATVAWTAPGSTGGSAITGYTVTSTPGARTCSTVSTSCVVTGLTNGAIYTFTVTATNAQGTGPASSASAGVTPAAAPSAPTAPSAAIGNAKAIVSWHASATHGAPVTLYRATSTPGGKICTTTTLTCAVTGLTNGTPYTFKIVALSSSGNSPASTTTNSITPAIGQWAGPPTTPAGYSNPHVVGVLPNGKIFGVVDGVNNTYGYVWDKLSDATPTPLAVLSGVNQCGHWGVSSGGEIWAACIGDPNDNKYHDLVWTSATATPVELVGPSSTETWRIEPVRGISASGEITYEGVSSNSMVATFVTSSPGTAPTLLQGSSLYPSEQAWASGFTSDGKYFGNLYANSTALRPAAVWSSATAAPDFVTSPPNVQVILKAMGSTGVIAGAGPSNSVYRWASAASSPVSLTVPSGYTQVTPVAVTPDGSVIATALDSATNFQDVVWTAGSTNPTTLSVLPSTTVSSITVAPDGTIYGRAFNSVVNNGELLVWASTTSVPSVVALPSGYSGFQTLSQLMSNMLGAGTEQGPLEYTLNP